MNNNHCTAPLRAGEDPVDYTLKILLLGDSGVGKTALLNRFSNGTYTDQMSSTIGVDFAVKRIRLYEKHLKLMLWDTAGQEKFRTLTSTFYRGAKGIIFVFDVSRAPTLEHLESQWMQELERYGTEDAAIRMVVANKVDVEEREVSWHEGADFARRHGCLFVETSARQNIAVQTAFEELVLKILDTPALLEGAEGAARPAGVVKLSAPAQSSYYQYCYC